MSKINCNSDLYWELYAKVLPLEVTDTIKLLGSGWARSLGDEEIKELLKLSRLKILAILELHTFVDFKSLEVEDQGVLTTAIEYAKEDEIARDAKDCFIKANANRKIKLELALITSRAKNSLESSYCLELASTPEISSLFLFKDIMKLIVSSSSFGEAKKIYQRAISFLVVNNSTIVQKLLRNYINSFYSASEVYEELLGPELDPGISYLEGITDSTCPKLGTKMYTRKPGHPQKIKARDLD